MAAKPGILSALIKQADGATDLTREEKQALLRDAAELIIAIPHIPSFPDTVVKLVHPIDRLQITISAISSRFKDLSVLIRHDFGRAIRQWTAWLPIPAPVFGIGFLDAGFGPALVFTKPATLEYGCARLLWVYWQIFGGEARSRDQ